MDNTHTTEAEKLTSQLSRSTNDLRVEEVEEPPPAPNKLASPKHLPFRTLRAGARVTRAIFDMPIAELRAFEVDTRIGPFTPQVHTPEPRPLGGR